jgi:NAD(P)-dependent dehydrogenase (short-subunit alcohol dehydrogenase family)
VWGWYHRLQSWKKSMSFAASVVLVAGGTGGLGRAVSQAFLNEGASVIVTYLIDQEFADLNTAARGNASSLVGQKIDVTDEGAVEQLIKGILADHGRLDVLVNAVGGYSGGMKLWEADTKILDHMLAINLRAGFVLSRAAARTMLLRGKGSIVNVVAKAAFDHPPGLGAYAASKAAALAMMDSLAADLKGTGVRANSILPSIIDTQANRNAMPKADFATWPKPEDIAHVILFLASDNAKVIHGAAIPVYGYA